MYMTDGRVNGLGIMFAGTVTLTVTVYNYCASEDDYFGDDS